MLLDISENRLKIAKELGADFTFTVKPSTDARTTAESIVALSGGYPDVTIECSGAESSLQTGIYVSVESISNICAFLAIVLFALLP